MQGGPDKTGEVGDARVELYGGALRVNDHPWDRMVVRHLRDPDEDVVIGKENGARRVKRIMQKLDVSTLSSSGVASRGWYEVLPDPVSAEDERRLLAIFDQVSR